MFYVLCAEMRYCHCSRIDGLTPEFWGDAYHSISPLVMQVPGAPCLDLRGISEAVAIKPFFLGVCPVMTWHRSDNAPRNAPHLSCGCHVELVLVARKGQFLLGVVENASLKICGVDCEGSPTHYSTSWEINLSKEEMHHRSPHPSKLGVCRENSNWNPCASASTLRKDKRVV